MPWAARAVYFRTKASGPPGVRDSPHAPAEREPTFGLHSNRIQPFRQGEALVQLLCAVARRVGLLVMHGSMSRISSVQQVESQLNNQIVQIMVSLFAIGAKIFEKFTAACLVLLRHKDVNLRRFAIEFGTQRDVPKV